MSEKTKKNEELQSRREFFKKAAKSTLPILAIATFGTTLLSCGDDEEEIEPGCNNSCSTSCGGTCGNGCWTACYTTCDSSCDNTCYGWAY